MSDFGDGSEVEMLDDVGHPGVLDGTWEGSYNHHNKAYSSKHFPITSTISQVGNSFQGIMVDGVTDFHHIYRRIVEANDGRMSVFAQHLASQTLERFPELTIETSLPEESRINGKIRGEKFSFTKTYLGPYSEYGNFGAGRVLLRRINQHRVYYRGTLITGGSVIEGQWSIFGGGFLGMFRRLLGSGGFHLIRKKSSVHPDHLD